MNPLSPFTYYRRHKRHTLLLVTLVSLVTLGVYLMVGMLHPIVEHSAATVLGPLTYFSLVYPAGDSSLEPAVVSQIRAHPGVSQVIPENGSDMYVNVPSLAIQNSLKVLGLSEADVQVLMDTCDLRLKEGRLLRPRTNEILLSEEVANALGLHVGDQIARSINENYYRAIMTPMVLVGILQSDPSAPDILSADTPSARSIGPSARSRQRARVVIVSYEYLASHELYSPRQSGFIVVPQRGRKAAVDDFLENTIRSPHTLVETIRWKTQLVARGRRMFNLIFTVVDCLVAAIVALVIGMINQIALTPRLADLGVLHAIGHYKNRLIRRLTLETTILAGVGWLIGLMLSWLALAWLKTQFYEPKGVELNLASPAPLSFAAPIPLAIIGFVTFSLVRTFARLDAVAIIERGKLSTETQIDSSAMKHSSSKPLSSWTFYLRHRRQGLALVATMGLMILGVAFPVFFFSPLIDAEAPLFLNYLRHVSEVEPGVGRAVDPGLIAQIRSHPAVARVVHATLLQLAISVPPATETVALIYGVSEADLPYLVDLFGLHLKEGHLPRARSNEIVLSETLAKNRGVYVGDTVGQPVYERDDSIPSEMVVVGVLQQQTAHPRSGQAPSYSDISLGFVSLEYVEGHELYSSRSVHLLVVPVEGHKAGLDKWLEENIASTQTLVKTYDARLREMRQATRNMFLLFAAIESVVAVVAATALAALNVIFFAQRRDEFGLMHAIGCSRTWLIFRTTKEMISAIAAAWIIGAAVCIVGLLYAQANVYAPVGLRLNLLNLSPWLFTLPIPVAVVAASTGTIAHMLTKLDPVSIIERR